MELVFTFCDKCNLEKDPSKVFEVPSDWAKVLGLQPNQGETKIYAVRGSYVGTFKEAADRDNWQERDYGHVCPVCITEEEMLDRDGEVLVVGPEDLKKEK